MNDIQSEMSLRAELPAIPALLADAASPAAARPVLHPRRGTAFDVDVASTPHELEALAGDWAAVEALCDARTVFQSYAAIRIWVRHFISPGRDRLHVAVVREGGRPVLILPLVITGRSGMRIAHLAGDPISQYSDILVDPAADGPAAFAAALDSVRAAGADAIVLRRVRADSSLFALAQEHLRPPLNEQDAPWADLVQFETYEAFIATLSKNMRKALRHRTHHLERADSIEFELYTGGPASRQAIAEAIDLKRTWMIQNGVVSTAFVDPATRECLLAFAEDPNAGAVTMKLSVDGVPAAIRFGFEYKGCYFAYLAAYEPGMSHFSPGKMLMDFYVKRFRERAISKIDMLPPSVRHKTDWCRQQTRVADYTLPLTYPGLVYAWLYQERMRPGLRRIWNHLPAGIRSVAAALFVSI